MPGGGALRPSWGARRQPPAALRRQGGDRRTNCVSSCRPSHIGCGGARPALPPGAAGPETAETVEGSTRLFVPADSLALRVPPREPAFFNPRARLSRDISVAAYAAFAGRGAADSSLFEALSGLGARGLRAASEAGIGRVVLNDLNAEALALAGRSASANGLGGVELSRNEACRFLLSRSARRADDDDGRPRSGRADMVDIDPFGSPAPYLDCCLRAVARGGMLSMTATDLQVLNGLFPAACLRRYGGLPIRRATFAAEVSLRLVLGCLCRIAGRLDLSIEPLLAHSDQHYYRAYVRVGGRSDQSGVIGYLHACGRCGGRGESAPCAPAAGGGRGRKKGSPAARGPPASCPDCGAPSPDAAGPLWTGPLFDGRFARLVGAHAGRLPVGRECAALLEKAAAEAPLPPTYYTLDEVASRLGTHPPKLAQVIESLKGSGFGASPTLFSPSGFRTDARIKDVDAAFRAAARQ